MSKLSRAAKKLARMSGQHSGTAAATAAAPARVARPLGARPDKPVPSRSTGPRTPAGKAISSQNARKHGLTSAAIYIPEDLQQEYAAMAGALQNELQPHGALEKTVFEQLLRASWNMYRIDIFEQQAITCPENLSSHDIAATLDRYRRYHAASERSFYKALNQLQALQTNRAHRDALAAELPAETPPLTKITDITKRTPVRRALQSAPAPNYKTNSPAPPDRLRSARDTSSQAGSPGSGPSLYPPVSPDNRICTPKDPPASNSSVT